MNAAGVSCAVVNKVTEGRPHIVDMIKNNEIALVINTVEERRNALQTHVRFALRHCWPVSPPHNHCRRGGCGAGYAAHGSPGRDFSAGNACTTRGWLILS